MCVCVRVCPVCAFLRVYLKLFLRMHMHIILAVGTCIQGLNCANGFALQCYYFLLTHKLRLVCLPHRPVFSDTMVGG